METEIVRIGPAHARLLERVADDVFEGPWVGTEVDNVPARTLYERRGSEAETFVLYFCEFNASQPR